MEGIEIFYGLTAAILGIAYPMLLQAISGLDERYKSSYVTDLFKSEPSLRYFESSLKVTITLFVVIGVLKLGLGAGIKSVWIDTLLIITNSSTLMCFFILVDKLFTFSSPKSITKHVINQPIKPQEKKQSGYLTGIFERLASTPSIVEPPIKASFDLLWFSIENPQHQMRDDLRRYIGETFGEFKKNNGQYVVDYPVSLLQLQYELSRKLCLKSNFTDFEVARKCTSGEWMIDWYQNLSISDSTFKWMFYNLNHVVEFQRDDYFKDYWEMASQNFKFHMQKIQPIRELTEDYNLTAQNAEEVETRDRLRRRYLEFHIALGGLVLYGRRLEALNFMLEFTQSYPPDYVLLPKTPRQLLELYVNFNDENNRDMKAIWVRYPFYGMSGLNADFAIRRWISQYLAILFVHQFTLKNQYTFENHAGFPEIPTSNIEKVSG